MFLESIFGFGTSAVKPIPPAITTELTRENFVAWLKTKNPDEEYSYLNTTGCAFAQFLHATGRNNIRVGNNYWLDLDAPGVVREKQMIPASISDHLGHSFRVTFGSL